MVGQAPLGRTGITVSRLILGCGGFGGMGSDHDLIGKGESDDEAAAIMDAAWEAGITTFDTADAYAGGRSEIAIGNWMRSRGTRPVITTKTFHPMVPGADSGLAGDRIRRQVDASLERLGIECIDLFVTHQPDLDTPLDQTLDTLEALVDEGKIRAFGGSHLTAELIQEAHGRYAWVQNSYSLLDRTDQEEVLPLIEAGGLGYTPYSPLCGGWLTGKYEPNTDPPPRSRMSIRPDPYRDLDRASVWQGLDAFREYAGSSGHDMITLAYAWVLSEPRVTAMLIGPRRPEQLHAAVQALDIELPPASRGTLAALFN
jgi:aryl-alcohol dehydrogenase-like predicted oxidoreductase